MVSTERVENEQQINQKVMNDSSNQLDSNRTCGCKGIRKCAICHPELLNHTDLGSIFPSDLDLTTTYAYCIACNRRDRFRPLNEFVRQKLERFLRDQSKFECICDDLDTNHQSNTKPLHVEGVYVKPEFLSADEELFLVEQIDTQNRWVESQSGRFKQDFGPKANFNKRKLKYSTFTGEQQQQKIIFYNHLKF